jgi:hypothetical protein
MRQEDAHVLDRCNQVILNLLSPEPAPACAFEVMIVSAAGLDVDLANQLKR